MSSSRSSGSDPAKASFTVGVDLGQRQDYTAIAVVERQNISRKTRFALRHLERLPLRTSYPEVVERVRNLAAMPVLAGRCTVVADATGVGGPVIDLLRQCGLGCPLAPVTITTGIRESHRRGYYLAPKRNLVLGLLVMLEQKRLQIAGRMAETAALVNELREMRIKISTAGNEKFGVWRRGEHDDLVLAVALACWWASRSGARRGAAPSRRA
jgi:hypothetical protein